MKFWHRLISVVGWLVRRDRAEQRLDDELQSYVEISAADKVRHGMSPAEARRLALIELGGIEPVRERVRTERHGQLVDEVGRDVRYGLRMFVRQPGFTIVILLTLALGIGANTAIFSLLDALSLRTLPARNPDELVLVNLRDRTATTSGGESLSYAIVRELDQHRDIFAGVGGFTGSTFDRGTPGAIVRVQGGLVTGSFYQTLGLQPAAGRLLTNSDNEPSAPLVAVISDRYWARQFSRSAGAVGQSVLLNGVPVTIVGVTPRDFDGANVGQSLEITVAVAALPRLQPSMAELLSPGNFFLRVLARPAAGLRARDAAARLNAIWPARSDSVISSRWPAARRQAMAASIFVLEPGATGWTYLREVYQKPLLVLQAIAGLVLLIACANVASLFLARASTRQREIAVRLAIGAGRRRIVRQLLIEGLIFSFSGAALGVGVAWLSSRFLLSLIATGPFPAYFDLTPNGHVLLFSIGLASLTGAAFGLAPALQTRRTGLSLSLKDDERTSSRRSLLLPALVSTQVAVSLILVAGAGLFVQTLRNLQHVNPGFIRDGVLVIDLDRGVGPAPDLLLDDVRRVPGVVSAAVATHTPLNGSSWSEAIVPAGQPMPEQDNARIIGVGPGFFATLQIPFAAGRDFASTDRAGHAGVAIVNEKYANRYFPNENPIGRHLTSNLMGTPADLEIVGVVKDTIASGLRRQTSSIVYVSFDQFGGKHRPSLVIRNAGATAAAEGVRAAVQAQIPTLLIEVRSLSEQINSTIIQERLMALLAGAFGVLALVLACVGLYGLLAYNVARRSREIGIRMALGASGAGVISLVLFQGLRLVAIGILIGYPVTWTAGRAVSSMLFGLTPADPSTTVGAIALLTAAAVIASCAPARRASRVDPVVVMRNE